MKRNEFLLTGGYALAIESYSRIFTNMSIRVKRAQSTIFMQELLFRLEYCWVLSVPR